MRHIWSGFQRSVGSVGITCLLASGCGAGSAVLDQSQASTTELSKPVPTESTLPPGEDPARFGGFPSEPTDQWLIGTEYIATAFTERGSDRALLTAEVGVRFLGRTQIGISAGGCDIGGGYFDWTEGRVTNPELASVLEMCIPFDTNAYDAALALIESNPEVRVDGDRLLLLSESYRLELQAMGPGVMPIVEDNERFIGLSTTVDGIDPAQIELRSPAYFVVVVTIPTCELHGAVINDDGRTTFQMEPDLGPDDCEYSPAEDIAARIFFAEETSVLRDGEVLEAANGQGTLQFRLATDADPPLAHETPVPPQRIIPQLPDRSQPIEAGELSAPWYTERAGSTDSGAADVPIPEGWEAPDQSVARVQVAGRGELEVRMITADQLPWNAEDQHATLELVEGPTSLTVKLYRQNGDQVVESCTMATVQQYRYGSVDPNEWRRQVVWILERNGTTTIATVSFPEFPTGSDFEGPADSINLALTGLDPIDLLNDIRFFE